MTDDSNREALASDEALGTEHTIHHVTVLGDEGRLDRALATHLPDMSRSRLKQWILNGHVCTTDDDTIRDPSYRVSPGQVFKIAPPPPSPSPLIPVVMPLDILAEDEAIIVLNKPPGLVVHPAPGHRHDTLVHGLLARHNLASGGDRPGIVHRLDKDTSGLLVIAKTDLAHRHLTRQFSRRQAGRVYLAVVPAPFRPKVGVIDEPIGRHRTQRQKMAVRPEGRPARTSYRVIEEKNGFAVVVCRLSTGRTHQIRVHLAHRGYPLIGDRVYGSDGRFTRQALHALDLTFCHPVTELEEHFESILADDLDTFLTEQGFAVPSLIERARKEARAMKVLKNQEQA